MLCLKVTLQTEPGHAAILGVHSTFNVVPQGRTLNRPGDVPMELAVVRIDFRALPSRACSLTLRLRRVVLGMLEDWLPGNELLIKSVKISLRLINLEEGLTRYARGASLESPRMLPRAHMAFSAQFLYPFLLKVLSFKGSK